MSSRSGALLLVLAVTSLSLMPRLAASELKPRTARAFEHYVDLTEARMKRNLAAPGQFLYFDTMPEQERKQEIDRIRSGQIFVRQLATKDGEKRVEIPDGLAHHWVAIGFIPHVKLERVLEVAEDFDHHAEYFKPDLLKSQLLSRDGGHYHVYFRFRRHAIVTVEYNTQFDIDFTRLDSTHVFSVGRAVRIAEVKNPGEKDEHELPVGNDRGFLWRLNLYTRYEQADDGVYVQIEFLALSRSVPAIFAWLVNPYIKSVPRDYLTNYIHKLDEVVHAAKPEAAEPKPSPPFPSNLDLVTGLTLPERAGLA